MKSVQFTLFTTQHQFTVEIYSNGYDGGHLEWIRHFRNNSCMVAFKAIYSVGNADQLLSDWTVYVLFDSVIDLYDHKF